MISNKAKSGFGYKNSPNILQIFTIFRFILGLFCHSFNIILILKNMSKTAKNEICFQ